MNAIEKNIPMPKMLRSRKGKTKYGFENMDVGDSIFFEGHRTTLGSPPYLSAAAYGKKYGKGFSGVITTNGLRIWRTA